LALSPYGKFKPATVKWAECSLQLSNHTATKLSKNLQQQGVFRTPCFLVFTITNIIGKPKYHNNYKMRDVQLPMSSSIQ
jgi:effector-binding domain-containing protein